MAKCWRRLLEKRVLKRCCREGLQQGIVVKYRKSVGDKRCRGVLVIAAQAKMPTSAQIREYNPLIPIERVNMRVRIGFVVSILSYYCYAFLKNFLSKSVVFFWIFLKRILKNQ